MADNPDDLILHVRISQPLRAHFEAARERTATQFRPPLSRAAFLRLLIELGVGRSRPKRRAKKGGRP